MKRVFEMRRVKLKEELELIYKISFIKNGKQTTCKFITLKSKIIYELVIIIVHIYHAGLRFTRFYYHSFFFSPNFSLKQAGMKDLKRRTEQIKTRNIRR